MKDLIMKRTLFALLCGSLLFSGTAFADEFDDLMVQADQAKTLNARLDACKQAEKIAKTPEQKLQAIRGGMARAEKYKETAAFSYFQDLLRTAEGASEKEKAEATYAYLMRESKREKWNSPHRNPPEWEEYLKMPGRNKAFDAKATLILADEYFACGNSKAAIPIMEQMINDENLPDAQRIEAAQKLVDLYKSFGRKKDAFSVYDRLLAKPKLKPELRYSCMCNKILLKQAGVGAFNRPDNEELLEIVKDWEAFMKIPHLPENEYAFAVTRIIDIYERCEKYKEALDLLGEVTDQKKHPMSLNNWLPLRVRYGRMLMEDFQTLKSLEVLAELDSNEGTRSYVDGMRWIAEVYYCTRQTTMAIPVFQAFYDKVQYDEDDRAQYAKYGMSRTDTFKAHAAQYDAMLKKHLARMKKKGIEPRKDSIYTMEWSAVHGASGGGMSAQPKKKKEIKDITDIKVDDAVNVEDGLDL